MRLMFYLNVFYFPTLKDFVGHYKLWNEVMSWFTQMMCHSVYIPLLYKARYVQRRRVMRFMHFLISITKNPILYSLYLVKVVGFIDTYIINTYSFFMLYRAH